LKTQSKQIASTLFAGIQTFLILISVEKKNKLNAFDKVNASRAISADSEVKTAHCAKNKSILDH
jgi:hypothetical protein